MNEVLERLRERNRADVKLESGLLVTLQLPNMRDCIAAGGIAIPVLQKLQESKGDVSVMGEDELAQFQRFQRVLVSQAVKAVEGEPVEIDPDGTGVFEDAEFYELVGYAMREKAIPGKA